MGGKRVLAGAALVLAVLLAGCSDPRNAALPEDMAKLESIKPQLEKLPEEERKLLVGYVMRRSLQGLIPGLGKEAPALPASTVGQAIEAQRKYVVDQEARQAAEKLALEQAKAKREAVVKAMRELVSVSLISKRIEAERGYSGIEMDRHLMVSFMFKNNSDKDIAGVKGRIEARDLFGDEISAFQISNDDTIKAGASIVWKGGRSVKYSLGNNKDEKLAEMGDDKFTLVWEPQAIVFADGTKADLPP